MSNIVYLLGAGASALALPPVNGMKGELMMLEQRLKSCLQENLSPETFSDFPDSFKENYKHLIPVLGDLRWLLKEAIHHETFDTLAKKYYLLNDYKSLKKLKTTLIVYFTLSQLCRLPIFPGSGLSGPIYPLVDKRYDSFIAAIAEKNWGKLQLSGNVKIITWNYDLQLELSLKRYVSKKILEIKDEFQIFPNDHSFEVRDGNLIDLNRFGVVKLNGNAFWDNPSYRGEDFKTNLFDKYFDDSDSMNILGKLLYQFYWLRSNNDEQLNEAIRYFNFAWEYDKDFSEKHAGYDNNISEGMRIASGADVLVVIGYSFPVFNRNIDKLLFDQMTRIKKVYIQDPEAEIKESVLKNAFKIFQQGSSLNQHKKIFQLENNTDNFVIPYEL